MSDQSPPAAFTSGQVQQICRRHYLTDNSLPANTTGPFTSFPPSAFNMNTSEAESMDLHDFCELGRSMREKQEEWSAVGFFDFDSYRCLDVLHLKDKPEEKPMTADELQAFYDKLDPEDHFREEMEAAATCRLLRPLVNGLPADVLAINMSASGKLLWSSTDPEFRHGWCTYYPSAAEYQFCQPIPTLLRSQLAVVDRLTGGVDKGSYKLPSTTNDRGMDKTAAFKYSPSSDKYGGVWSEIQIMSQLPAHHPHLLPLDSLVLEEVSGLGVVGFTTPFIPAATLVEKLPHVFKLRWLKELMAVVDELNLEYGIVHQDIADRNIFINPATDSILLFDFDVAAGVGHGGPGYSRHTPARNDVKGVVLLAYYLVTRDPRYADFFLDLADEKDIEDREKWMLHADVTLDHDVSAFYDGVMTWEAKRHASPELTHYTQAPKAIKLLAPPSLPEDTVVFDGQTHSTRLISIQTLCKTRLRAGRPVLSWHRPLKANVDKSRRLLATGRYADEEPETEFIAVPDPKRGFPQPPVVVVAKATAKRKRAVSDKGRAPCRRSPRRHVVVGAATSSAAVGESGHLARDKSSKISLSNSPKRSGGRAAPRPVASSLSGSAAGRKE